MEISIIFVNWNSLNYLRECIASIYEQYIAGLSDIGQVPFLLRYNAFPEAHLDSLENPAYATTFKAAEGRVVFLPSLNGSGGLDENPTPPGLSFTGWDG